MHMYVGVYFDFLSMHWACLALAYYVSWRDNLVQVVSRGLHAHTTVYSVKYDTTGQTVS